MNTRLWTALLSGSALLIVGAVGRELARDAFRSEPTPASRQYLLALAGEINKRCPMAVDEHTEIMNVGAADSVIIYNYRLIGSSADSETRALIMDTLRPRVVRSACTTPKTRDTLLNAGVAMRYVYYADDRSYIAEFDVRVSQCGPMAASDPDSIP